MELTKIRERIHSELLDLRNTERFVFGETFEEAYKKSKDIDRQAAEVLIRAREISLLKTWAKKILSNGRAPENMNFEQLRKKAGEMGIPRYNTLNKTQLVSTIKRQEKLDGEKEKRASQNYSRPS